MIIKLFYNHIMILELLFILILNNVQINNCSPKDRKFTRVNNIKKRNVTSKNVDPISYQNYLNVVDSVRQKSQLVYRKSHKNSNNFSYNDNSNFNNKTRKSLSTKEMKKKKNSQLKDKCNKAEKELDLCSAQLLSFGLNEAIFPNNVEQFDSEYCPRFKKLVTCIRNNTECYQPFEKHVITWVTISSRRLNYKRCKSEYEKLQFLRLTTSCFSNMKNPMDKCMRKYIANLEAIADLNDFIERLSENDIQIQLSCCANLRFKQCILNNAKQQCKPHDSIKKLKRTNSLSSQKNAQKQLDRKIDETIRDLNTTLNNMALTGPEFICRGVDEDYCQIHFDGKIVGRQTKHKSIVPAMVRIYSNL